MPSLGTRELRRLLDVVGAIEYSPDADAFSVPALSMLRELIESRDVTYIVTDDHERRIVVDVYADVIPFEGHCPELEAVMFDHSYENPWCTASAPASGVLTLSEVASRRRFTRTGYYNEWCRVVHTVPEAKIFLPRRSSDGLRRHLMCGVTDGDCEFKFGQWEREILELVRPHFLRPIAQAEALRAHQHALGLTVRELEVLDLVRAGHTNGEIAQALFISPFTVRKHLENIFAKLGAHTRAEAVARTWPSMVSSHQ